LNNPPAQEGVPENVNEMNEDNAAWEEWLAPALAHAQNNLENEDQFSFQLLRLEELNSLDSSIGLSNGFLPLLPNQHLNQNQANGNEDFHPEHVQEQVEAILALPIGLEPVVSPALEQFQNNGMHAYQAQYGDNMVLEDNMQMGYVRRVDGFLADLAFEEYQAKKCATTWAKFFPLEDTTNVMMVPKSWAAFFMGLLIRPYSAEWAKKFLASDDVATLMEPGEEMILVPCQQEKETTNSPIKRKH
jgi:hypothetical protein